MNRRYIYTAVVFFLIGIGLIVTYIVLQNNTDIPAIDSNTVPLQTDKTYTGGSLLDGIRTRLKVLSVVSDTGLPLILPKRFSYDPTLLMPVRDQGSCNSCWAFVTCGVLGDRVAIQSNQEYRVHLSPQQLMSCSLGHGGCEVGGYLYLGLQYAEANGLFPEDYMAYTADDGTVCVASVGTTYRVSAQDIQIIGEWTEIGSQQHLDTILLAQQAIYSQGPIAANIQLVSDLYGLRSYQIYSSSESTSDLYHAIEIVGWYKPENTSFAGAYWVIKNTWSKNWPEPSTDGRTQDGYAYIQMGVNMLDIEKYMVNVLPVLTYRSSALELSARGYDVVETWEQNSKQANTVFLYGAAGPLLSGGVALGMGLGAVEAVYWSMVLLSVLSVSLVLTLFFLLQPAIPEATDVDSDNVSDVVLVSASLEADQLKATTYTFEEPGTYDVIIPGTTQQIDMTVIGGGGGGGSGGYATAGSGGGIIGTNEGGGGGDAGCNGGGGGGGGGARTVLGSVKNPSGSVLTVTVGRGGVGGVVSTISTAGGAASLTSSATSGVSGTPGTGRDGTDGEDSLVSYKGGLLLLRSVGGSRGTRGDSAERTGLAGGQGGDIGGWGGSILAGQHVAGAGGAGGTGYYPGDGGSGGHAGAGGNGGNGVTPGAAGYGGVGGSAGAAGLSTGGPSASNGSAGLSGSNGSAGLVAVSPGSNGSGGLAHTTPALGGSGGGEGFGSGGGGGRGGVGTDGGTGVKAQDTTVMPTSGLDGTNGKVIVTLYTLI